MSPSSSESGNGLNKLSQSLWDDDLFDSGFNSDTGSLAEVELETTLSEPELLYSGEDAT